MIPVNVHSVATDESQKHYFAVLKAENSDSDRWLPVRLGAAEAVSIATEINETGHNRPVSHDLITRSIHELGGTVERIRIDQSDDELTSTIDIVTESDGNLGVDARPSDALAVAVRTDVEVVVPEDLLGEWSGDLEEQVQGAHPSSEVTRLQGKLRKAVENEDYERAAELKPEIQSAIRRYEESVELDDDVENDLESAYRGTTPGEPNEPSN